MNRSKYYLVAFLLLIAPLLMATHGFSDGGLAGAVLGYFGFVLLLTLVGGLIVKITLWLQG